MEEWLRYVDIGATFCDVTFDIDSDRAAYFVPSFHPAPLSTLCQLSLSCGPLCFHGTMARG